MISTPCSPALPSLHRIRRPLRQPFLSHVGLLAADGTVYHMTKSGLVEATSLAAFADGMPVTTEGMVPTELLSGTWARIRATLGVTYAYATFTLNCEHWRNWVLTSRARSTQARVAVGVMVVAFALLCRGDE